MRIGFGAPEVAPTKNPSAQFHKLCNATVQLHMNSRSCTAFISVSDILASWTIVHHLMDEDITINTEMLIAINTPIP